MRALRSAFVVAVALFFARVVLDSTDELRDLDLRIRPAWLVAAFVLQIAGFPLLPLGWHRLVSAAGHGRCLSPLAALRVWSVSQVGRFVPTALPAFAARTYLSAQRGVPRSATVATMAVELLLIVGVGAVFGAVLLTAWWPVALAAAAGTVAGPFVLRGVSPRVPRLRADWSVPRLFGAEAVFVANAVVKGGAFACLAAALLPVSWSDVPLLVGSLNAAAVLGTVGVTPAGLGVREGAMAALLRAEFGLGDAAALAVAHRGFELAVELLWLGVVQLRPFRPAPDEG